MAVLTSCNANSTVFVSKNQTGTVLVDIFSTILNYQTLKVNLAKSLSEIGIRKSTLNIKSN